MDVMLGHDLFNNTMFGPNLWSNLQNQPILYLVGRLGRLQIIMSCFWTKGTTFLSLWTHLLGVLVSNRNYRSGTRFCPWPADQFSPELWLSTALYLQTWNMRSPLGPNGAQRMLVSDCTVKGFWESWPPWSACLELSGERCILGNRWFLLRWQLRWMLLHFLLSSPWTWGGGELLEMHHTQTHARTHKPRSKRV